MAPQPQGAPRWDARTQRWVWDAPADAPAPAAPPQAGPSQAPPAYDPLAPTAPQAYDPGRPPVPPAYEGNLPPLPPVYDPHLPPPPPVPPGPPRPGGAGGRWLTPTTAGVAVAALAIGAAAVWFVERKPSGPPARAGATASDASVAGGASGSRPPRTSPTADNPTGSPSASTGSPADGAHETVRDPKGFTIAVPTGWAREESGSGVFYRSPDRTSLLQVFRVSEAELSPLQAVQGASTDLRARTSGYEEIRVGQVPGFDDAAELVYEYDSVESHGRRRGVERVSRTPDGGKWAVLTAGPAADWAVTRAHHTAALEAFRPGG
ncbi:hypothetical protein ABZ934_13555 [Streptomyces sp. NPDC046557]|uniref:hypothetical protein n=1 Tax=Streptomyces sp. NPDC046557 TaxID=3155372 RepID=UPI0033FC6B17